MRKHVALGALLIAALDSSAQQADTAFVHDEVVVTGTREATLMSRIPSAVTVVGRSEIENGFQSSLVPVVALHTPGMFATQRGVIGYGISANSAGSIKVRGVGSGARLLVLVDGQPQYSGLLGHPVPDLYQGMNAERVEVIRGPQSVLYGSNAMGGVINIVTRKAGEQGLESGLSLSGGSYGTLQAQSSNAFGRGRVSGVANISCQRTHGHRPRSSFRQRAGYFKLGCQISQRWKAMADISLTDFAFQNPGPEGAELLDSDARIGRGLASVSVSNSGRRTGGSVRAFLDWGRHNISDGHLASAPPLDYKYMHRDYIGGANAFQSIGLAAGGSMTLGADFQMFGGKAWNQDLDGGARQYYGPIENMADWAVYADFRQDIAGVATVNAGLRADTHSNAGTEIVPMAGVAFRLPHHQDIKLLAGKGFRNPTISEMYMFAPNPGLEPERMASLEASYSKRAMAGSFGCSAFFIKGSNLIERVPREGGSGYININAGEFTNYGFEMEGSLSLGRWWAVDGNFSYLHTKIPVTGAPGARLCVKAAYSRGRWGASASVENVSGLVISLGDSGEDESYTLLNSTLSCQVARRLMLFARGENLLAERYRTYSGFWMPKATFMAGARLSFKSKSEN